MEPSDGLGQCSCHIRMGLTVTPVCCQERMVEDRLTETVLEKRVIGRKVKGNIRIGKNDRM